MIDRIAVFGTESTGKTTLAQYLAQRFAVPWAEEYVRAFWDRHDGRIHAADLGSIAQGQIDNQTIAESLASRLVICDTELVTNALWADLLFPGACPNWVREAAERRCQDYALYLLCDIDIDFIDDGQRCFPNPDERHRAGRIWRDALTRRDLPFVDIRGTWPQRTATAIDAIIHTTGVYPD